MVDKVLLKGRYSSNGYFAKNYQLCWEHYILYNENLGFYGHVKLLTDVGGFVFRRPCVECNTNIQSCTNPRLISPWSPLWSPPQSKVPLEVLLKRFLKLPLAVILKFPPSSMIFWGGDEPKLVRTTTNKFWSELFKNNDNDILLRVCPDKNKQAKQLN